MNLNLNDIQNKKQFSAFVAFRSLWSLISVEWRILLFSLCATLVTVGVALFSPLVMAHILDGYIVKGQFSGILPYIILLLILYVLSFFSNYLQIKFMGEVGQRVLFKLRNAIFDKLQGFPLAFFHINRAGDLISRINNDTDKLNQFFSQTLVQFVGSAMTMCGAVVFVLVLNFELGIVTLLPIAFVLLITYIISPWIKRANENEMNTTGGLSAEVSEGLHNFKAIVAFNRRDFFRERFALVNEANFQAAFKASIATGTLSPIYNFSSYVAQLIVLSFGIYLISQGHLTIGLLVSYLSYVNNLYNPLRQIAALWGNFQVALAGWNRISSLLQLQGGMEEITGKKANTLINYFTLSFNNVSFHYSNGKEVLKNISFDLEAGKTYALIGPTGGGKTTTASLMARLYDPTEGTVYLNGQDIRSYPQDERTKKIGFILQEPILFSGTVKENILYGNKHLQDCSLQELEKVIYELGLDKLLLRFSDGLETKVATEGDALSLGQKQLIAFMRIVLREPDLLILDEATANIDTVTENLLEEIMDKLPSHTTKVIIAHRLNTIEKADIIYFVNSGELLKAGSMSEALSLLEAGIQTS